MGSWGTALYSNDTSSDVRDMCNEVYPLVGIEKGTQLILDEYTDIVNSNITDNDYADFWFALADWQWKHGILTDEIKNKTIALLEAHTGIEEWKESGSAANVKKRLAVMDKLLAQLKTPQPDAKIPKPKIAKPKHQPGDIIIVRTCTKDHPYAESLYNIHMCTFPFVYSPEIADKVAEEINPPYEAYNKYIAILCVGTEKRLHSQYVDDIFDEYSVYVFYDYLDEERPTLAQLQQCGFLPHLAMYGQDRGGGIGTLEWQYKFILYCYRFKLDKNGFEQSIEKLSCLAEQERFRSLFARKNYSDKTTDEWDLYQVFGPFFREKIRLTLAEINYDNLLNSNISNPTLRSKKEVSKLIAQNFRQNAENQTIHMST